MSKDISILNIREMINEYAIKYLEDLKGMIQNRDNLKEIKHAHWVNGICTNCGVEKPVVVAYRGFDEIVYQYKGELNYCPNCGAEMDEEDE